MRKRLNMKKILMVLIMLLLVGCDEKPIIDENGFNENKLYSEEFKAIYDKLIILEIKIDEIDDDLEVIKSNDVKIMKNLEEWNQEFYWIEDELELIRQWLEKQELVNDKA